MQSNEMEDYDEGPSEVNTTKASHLVHTDKLTVTYNGKGNHNQDVGSVQANRPFSNRVLIGYFEVTVVSAGQRGCMAIGLANADFNLMRQPGWEPWSYGYHGEDGRKFFNSSRGEPYGGKEDGRKFFNSSRGEPYGGKRKFINSSRGESYGGKLVNARVTVHADAAARRCMAIGLANADFNVVRLRHG
ncbi:hypothetical protein T484DRAFT_1839239 [Baffinella frigidus]|nr:hypothetical protein T484DRAFT_1839239 [Cryptophyta sp. CCMP2293]